MRVVTVKMSDELIRKIDEAAKFLGFPSRGALIRSAVIDKLIECGVLNKDEGSRLSSHPKYRGWR